jgi:Asp-tRNA(Asn)/Glu-tRNA(Gln) amidotransferase A subunit family amidase
MPTTAGSLAFEGSVTRTDAFITRNACAFRIARTDDD